MLPLLAQVDFTFVLGNKTNTIMWDLFKILIGIILLILIVPLLWLLIKLIIWFFGWVFGGLVGSGIAIAAGDILGVLFVIACIVFVIWCIAS